MINYLCIGLILYEKDIEPKCTHHMHQINDFKIQHHRKIQTNIIK